MTRQHEWPKKLAVVLIAGAMAFVGARVFYNGTVAPIPAMFEQGLTLDQAVLRAEQEGKLVFLVAGADWCPKCNAYKRRALVDFDVQGWVSSYALPVYLDVELDPDAGEQIEVEGIPATILYRDGREIARREGALTPSALLEWLDSARRGDTEEQR